ncbi:MAG: cytochrome C, partial [Rhodoferax sp.]|nr:cytochrome C [Rhodoferax sp.]
MHAVKPDKFGQSVHAKMSCVACHADIKDNAETANAHAKDPALKLAKVDCAGCHQQLWDDAKTAGAGKDKPQLELVAKNIDAYKASFHARPNADDATKPNASCDNCHDTHSFNVPAKKTPEYDQWRLGISNNCGTCHEDQLDDYAGSVHGKEVLEKNNPKAAVCSDCHGSHSITNSSGDPFKLAVTQQCGSCHEENLKTYMATYHGKISTLGYAYTAKCYDCHGSHKILKTDDPKSMVHIDNRLKTCQSCHSGKEDLALAPAGFSSFQPHGH